MFISEEPIEDKGVVSNGVNKQLMEDVLNGINTIRKNAGLNELLVDLKVEEAAIIRAKEMVESDICSHDIPNNGHYTDTMNSYRNCCL